MKEGLSHDVVKSLCQDSKGFLWIGTYSGLNKFDGYQFTRYVEDPSDSNSLLSPSVNCLLEDDQQRLWIGTDGGIQLLDLKTEKFQQLRMNPGKSAEKFDIVTTSFRRREDGNVWICTYNGIFLANPKTLVVKQVANFPSDGNRGKYWDIVETKEGTLWASSEEGIVEFNPDYGKAIRHLHDPAKPGSLLNNTVKRLHIDTKNRLWAGTQQGLDLFDPKTQSFIHFLPESLSATDVVFEIMAINESADGKIWVGSGHGLNVFDPEKRRFELLIDQAIWSILEDGQGNTWVGAVDGVYQIAPILKKFKIIQQFGSMSISDARPLAEDKKNNIWIAVHNPGYHLFKYNPFNMQFYQFLHDRQNPHSYFGNVSRAISKNLDGGLWISSYKKLYKLDSAEKTFEGFDLPIEPTEIFTDSESHLWLGGWNGIGIFDVSTESFQPVPDFPRAEVTTILEDNFKHLWISTTDGLARYNLTNGQLKVFRQSDDEPEGLSHNRINQIILDDAGTLWLASSGGLSQMMSDADADHPVFRHWTPSNSNLPHNEVWDVIDAKDGTLWITCGNNISHFSPQTETFRNYDDGDGLHGQSIYKGLRGNDGQIYLFSRDGLILFHPDSIEENLNKPPVVITTFSVHNRIVNVHPNTPSDRSLLTKTIPYTNEITLAYNQNNLTLEFSALNFIHQEKNQYKYKLEPYEKNWIEASAANRVARYTNISPGNYVFRVIGSNNDGVWNEEGAMLRITILPPWWQTWTAYSLYVIAIISLVLLWRNYENKRLMLKHRADHLSELDTLKSRFFTNISHEFRTPITLILGPLKEMYKGAFKGDLQSTLGVMVRNAQRLLQLINQLLDLSKLEVGKMSLRAVPVDLVQFLSEVAASYESLAAEKKIEYFFDHDFAKLTVYIDHEKLEKVVHNVLSNAFKFTPSNGHVTLSLSIQNQKWAAIKICDTGIGIASEQLPKIFDRFYQVDNSQTRKYEGTGLGMALTKELVQLHHGKISVESEEGKGSTFVVLLPLGNAHLSKDEIGTISSLPATHSEFEQVVVAENYAVDSPPKVMSDIQPIVLIIEDNHDMRDYIQKTLFGKYQFICAENGKEGLVKASSFVPDIIISDVMMPEMDGYKLCETVKSNEITSHIPIILLTAKADQSSKLLGLEIGADDYLPKPFDADELRLIVRNRLESRNKLKDKFSREVTLEPKEISITSFDERFIGKLLEIIEQHMDDESFSIEALANEVGYSSMHLYRKIKALSGQTPSQFLRTIRLKRAAALLAKDSDNVTQIAYSVGFSSLSYFSKCFKEQFGVPPGKFAEKA
jgi:signal transduction histidine kinase/ligand-binding sensor domain-containing protein/AraC-like DNA-binding protein/AmiR/NasT family two-component response regulator